MNPSMIELIKAFGWIKIETRNFSMISFKNAENNRINIYTSKMTITIQIGRSCLVFKNVNSIEKLENLLEINK